MLYIVSSPIGNLEDISYRAVETLKACDLILAEDTRRTGKLLRHLGIEKKMLSYNDHNRVRRIPYVIELLAGAKSIALCSDAGTPGIADPGFRLVQAAVNKGIRIVPVPGASSVLAALVCSGMPTDEFRFIGWLPKKQGQKKKIIESINCTTVCLESPYRIEKTLKMIHEANPTLQLCICRELTKMHEEFIRGTAEEIMGKKKKLKGEITLVMGTGTHAQC